jgi:hypothetical protein
MIYKGFPPAGNPIIIAKIVLSLIIYLNIGLSIITFKDISARNKRMRKKVKDEKNDIFRLQG